MAEIKNGQICHIEIPAPNMKKTRKFYEKLFGWKTGPEMGKTYCMFFDGAMGGGFDSTAKPSKNSVRAGRSLRTKPRGARPDANPALGRRSWARTLGPRS